MQHVADAGFGLEKSVLNGRDILLSKQILSIG
jgi:hypothetical protein